MFVTEVPPHLVKTSVETHGFFPGNWKQGDAI